MVCLVLKKLFDKIDSKKETLLANERARLESFENNTPGIKIIADTIVNAIVNPTSGVVQNMRNNVHGQYLLFTKFGIKHIVQVTSGINIKQLIKETPYNFNFAELGKNPLQSQDVEKFKDLIRLKLGNYHWMRVTSSYIHTDCMDAISSASLEIEKYATIDIPETFW